MCTSSYQNCILKRSHIRTSLNSSISISYSVLSRRNCLFTCVMESPSTRLMTCEQLQGGREFICVVGIADYKLQFGTIECGWKHRVPGSVVGIAGYWSCTSLVVGGSHICSWNRQVRVVIRDASECIRNHKFDHVHSWNRRGARDGEQFPMYVVGIAEYHHS